MCMAAENSRSTPATAAAPQVMNRRLINRHDAPTATGAPGAPVLALIGDRIVAVGETLSIVLTATDGDDVDLSFSVYGQLPDGATFDKLNQTFEWTRPRQGSRSS